MSQKCQICKHWNVPIEFDSKEVVLDISCDPGFIIYMRAVTKSHWVRSKMSEGKGTAAGAGIAHCLKRVDWAEKGNLTAGRPGEFLSLSYCGKLKHTYMVRRSREG